MKIINLIKTKSFVLFILYTICLLNLITNVYSECSIKKGCLIRKKFMSYVTVLEKDGKPSIGRSLMNYKVLYIFTDRLVFYSSSDSGSATLEPDSDPDIQVQESKI